MREREWKKIINRKQSKSNIKRKRRWNKENRKQKRKNGRRERMGTEEETKQKRIKEKTEIMRFFRGSARDLKNIFDLMNHLVASKNMIVGKLQQMKQVTNTFLRTDDGFKVTNPEGFVAVDKLKGNAVKLIDRLEFAHANFNAAKAWTK